MKNLFIILFVLLFFHIGFGQEKFLLDSTSLTFQLKIEKVKDIISGETLKDVKIKIIGTDSTLREIVCDSIGVFPFIDLQPNTSYSTIVWKEGFLNAKGNETTIGEIKSSVFVHEYALQPSHVSFFPIMPIVKFNFNSVEPIIEEGDYNSFFNLMNENETIIIQITSYRKSSEKKNLSKRRAMFFAKKMIKRGVNKNRLVLVNGGINIKESIDENQLKFKVIRDDYAP